MLAIMLCLSNYELTVNSEKLFADFLLEHILNEINLILYSFEASLKFSFGLTNIFFLFF